MRYLSICSGIEAATVAWDPLGWTPAGFAEVDAFPSAVLRHHYPAVKNHGDFTGIDADAIGPIDLLVGGTPCQSFSIAGLRKGLGCHRGNLALEFLELAYRTRAPWVVWENVPGVLSSDGGRDFGSILGGLVELGYGFAYRVLDAQYVRVDGYPRAVPQRRRRVFVVGYLGDWRRAAAVLFERESLSGDPAPRRSSREGSAREVAPSLTGSGRGVERPGESRGQDPVIAEVANPLTARMHKGVNTTMDEGQTMIPVNIYPSSGQGSQLEACEVDVANTVSSVQNGKVTDRGTRIVSWAEDSRAELRLMGDIAGSLMSKWTKAGQGQPTIMQELSVRRLTPVECERLMGFPDGYTEVPYRGKPASDGPRYKALGNSMAVNVMRWIGKRIDLVSELPDERTRPSSGVERAPAL